METDIRHRAAFLLIAGLFAGARAEAQMRVVDQTRTVLVRAIVAQANPPLLQQTEVAPDNGPFNVSPSVQLSSVLGNASALGSQNSSIAADRIAGVGITNTNASAAFNPNASSQGQTLNTLEVVFDLDYPVRFDASGFLFIDSFDASPYVRLHSAAGSVFWLFPTQSFGNTPIDETGVLAPGRYTLTAFAESSAAAAEFWWFGHRSDFNLDFRVESLVGDNYCATNPNSSGTTAVIGASGSPFVSHADLGLHVSGAMPNVPGIFFYGPSQVSQPFGSGVMCVGAPRYRLSGPAQTNAVGALDHFVDFNSPPAGAGPSAFAPGVTWNFQFWYRDPAASPTFNTSNGLSIAFQ